MGEWVGARVYLGLGVMVRCALLRMLRKTLMKSYERAPLTTRLEWIAALRHLYVQKHSNKSPGCAVLGVICTTVLVIHVFLHVECLFDG